VKLVMIVSLALIIAGCTRTEQAVTGAAAGGVTGAVVAGPLGAAVGAGAGAVAAPIMANR